MIGGATWAGNYRWSLPDEGCPIAVLCGIPTMAATIGATLERQGLRLDAAAPVALVVDAPPGFALHVLDGARAPMPRLVVVTENHCAEYLADLWDLYPAALLVGRSLALDLAGAITRAAQGERLHSAPHAETPLTPTERRMLRLLACGQSNVQIARQLAMQVQTVKNGLVAIYQKLGCKNRCEALLYYWGIWQSRG